MIRPAEAEHLLRHTDWLRELARSILRDPQGAEDVAQDAWVAALERPPRVADVGAARAWLGEVTRNLARTRLRREGRRQARERGAARPEAVAAVDETLQRVATQRALVDAVLALEPADREVVVLRYFEGWPPRRIARELRTSSAAVRSRLSRALGKLRARLGAEEDGLDSRALLLLVQPGSGVAPAGTGIVGGWLVNSMAKLALAVAALVVALVWFGRGSEAPASHPLVAPAAEASADAAPSEALALEAASSADARTSEVAITSSPPSAVASEGARSSSATSGERIVVQARIVDGAGEPLAGASLTAVDLREPVSATSGADGRVRLEIAWPMQLARGNDSWVFVEASLPGWTRVKHQERIVGPDVLEIGALRLEPGGDVAGRVIDASGRPIGGAHVYAVGGALPGTADQEEERRVRGWPFAGAGSSPLTSTSAEDGSYRIEGVPARSISIVARSYGKYFAYTPPIDVPAGGEARAQDLVLSGIEPKNAIEGVVADAHGPLRAARVSAFENHGARNIDPRAATHTDEAGRFRLLVLADSIHTLVATDPRARGRELVVHDVRAGDLGLSIVFPEQRSIRLVVEDERGEPIAGAKLQLFEHPTRHGILTEAEPHPDGGLRLSLPTTDFGIGVFATGYLPQSLGPFELASVPESLVARMERAGALRGRVTVEGAPLPGCHVHFHALPRHSTIERFDDGLLTRWDAHYGRPPSVETDAEGRFELFVTAAGPFLVHAEADGLARAEAGPFEPAVGDSVDGIELRCTPGSTLAGRVRVDEGADVEGTIVAISRADGHVDSIVVGEDGAYRFEHLAPGGWQVRRGTTENQEWLRIARTYPVSDGEASISFDVELREGATTEYDLDFSHEKLCTVSGTLALDGAWESGWHGGIGDAEHRASGPVGPDGSYRLSFRASERARLCFDASTPTGARMQLLGPLFTPEPVEQIVDWSASTGAVELSALPPRAPSEGIEGYALVRTDAARWIWFTTFDADEHGRCTLERVPDGTVELRRRDSPRSMHPLQWPAIATFEVKRGERVRFAAPREH